MNILRESTISNPLAFFRYFIQLRGFERFHESFFKGLDFDLTGIPIEDVDEKDESYSYYCPDESGYHKRKVVFREDLEKVLNHEVNKAVANIHSLINTLSNKELIVNQLILQIEAIGKLIEKAKSSSELIKYDVHVSLYRLVSNLYHTLPLFLPYIKSAIIIESLEFLESYQKRMKEDKVVKSTTGITSFKWTADAEQRTVVLYEALTKTGAISKKLIPLEKFGGAFDGRLLSEPLGINWNIKYHNSYSNTIFRLIWKLADRGYLVKDSQQITAKIIGLIFQGNDGSILKNLDVKVNNISKELSNDLKEKHLHEEINRCFPDKSMPKP